MRVLLRGAFNSQTGYGNDLLGMTKAFLMMGADVYLYPMSVTPPLPSYVADLLTKDLMGGAPYDLAIEHTDPGQLSFADSENFAEIVLGWTMWERCVDERTMIFTKRGWLHFEDVLVGDETLGINQETGCSEWTTVSAVNIYPARSRELLLMELGDHSSLTTAAHRWYIRNNAGNWKWLRSDELGVGHNIPRFVPRGDAGVAAPKFSDELVELIAWMCADGWLERGKSVRIGKLESAYPAATAGLRGLLTSLLGAPVERNNPSGGRTWSEHPRKDGMRIFSISREVSLELLELAPGRVPSLEFLFSLTKSQLNLFIDTFLLVERKISDSRRPKFGQTDESRAEAFLFACVLAGRNIKKLKVAARPTFFSVRDDLSRSEAPAFCSPHSRNAVRWERYDGKVWCPTTGLGTWLARRGDSMYYTGNSTLDNLKQRVTLRKRLANVFDLVIGYDEVSAGALRPYCVRTSRSEGVKLGVLQGGFWPDDWKPVERDWHSDSFGYCMLGMLGNQRKNTFLAIQAFRELKEEYPEFASASLTLKTQDHGLHPALEQSCDKLFIIRDIWTNAQIRDFYGKNHVLLAPSKGEGKNLPALEMMSTGGTVIATNWGGHASWLSDEYAYPLDYKLAPMSGAFPDCLEANASKDHLKELMLRVFRNRSEAEQKGNLASTAIPELCSWQTVIGKLIDKLPAALPGKGEKLRDLALRCRPREL